MGNDSLASALVGSTDFYDMLSKMELMKRVAKHDDELIDSLVKQLNEYNTNIEKEKQQKKDLQIQMGKLSDTKKEQQEAMDKLPSDYQKTQDEINRINQEKENNKSNKAELQAANERLANQEQDILDEIARKQREKAAEEERKRQEALENSSGDSSNDTSDDNSSDDSSSDSDNGSSYNGQFTWPVPGYYYISSGYGYRSYDNEFHRGIDIAGGGIDGAPIVAAESGVVTTACSDGYGGGYGNYLVIDHGNGLSTLYGHCSSLAVSEGSQVEKGQTIAYVGSTGDSSGYHLHFSVIKNSDGNYNGEFVDPMSYVG
jgi:murein DD-endopeptidase MepM/ murein hydrolase activator NlpD